MVGAEEEELPEQREGRLEVEGRRAEEGAGHREVLDEGRGAATEQDGSQTQEEAESDYVAGKQREWVEAVEAEGEEEAEAEADAEAIEGGGDEEGRARG